VQGHGAARTGRALLRLTEAAFDGTRPSLAPVVVTAHKPWFPGCSGTVVVLYLGTCGYEQAAGSSARSKAHPGRCRACILPLPVLLGLEWIGWGTKDLASVLPLTSPWSTASFLLTSVTQSQGRGCTNQLCQLQPRIGLLVKRFSWVGVSNSHASPSRYKKNCLVHASTPSHTANRWSSTWRQTSHSPFHWMRVFNPVIETGQPATNLWCVSRRPGGTKTDPPDGFITFPS
jgi:hypothetical protein